MMFIVHSEDFRQEDVPPSLFEAMGKFVEETQRSGAFIDGAGLQPTKEGFRVRLSKGKLKFTDGPFTEAKELVAGYWLLEAKSKEEVIEWMKRAPFRQFSEQGGEVEVEIRQLYELDDFGDSAAIDRARELERKLGQKR
jgi:hypothetical protein